MKNVDWSQRKGRTSGRSTSLSRGRSSEAQTVFNHDTNRWERYKVTTVFASSPVPHMFRTVRQVGLKRNRSNAGPNFKRRGRS